MTGEFAIAGASLWVAAALLLQGLLALAVLVYLGTVRLPMIARGEVRVHQIALDRGGWPERERRVSNAFDNQFQLPVLLYLGGILAILFGATWFEALLACLFVASRFVHAYIHVTDNHVIRRFIAFCAGLAILVLLWLDLLVRLILAATGN